MLETPNPEQAVPVHKETPARLSDGMDADKIQKTRPIPRLKLGAGTEQGCDAGMTITSSEARISRFSR
jgi:hypothetical protein